MTKISTEPNGRKTSREARNKMLQDRARRQLEKAEVLGRVPAEVMAEMTTLMDYRSHVVYVRQTHIAERLRERGVRCSDRSVRRAFRTLKDADQIADLNAGLRNRAHRYKLLLDPEVWAGVSIVGNGKEPSAPKLTVKSKPVGYSMPNRNECSCEKCGRRLKQREGVAIKLHGGDNPFRAFCPKHVDVGQAAAESPEATDAASARSFVLRWGEESWDDKRVWL